MSKKKVIIGLSGGVDSSVGVIELLKQGYDVEAMFMRNWDSATNNDMLGNPTLNDDVCPQEVDYQDAVKVAEKLGATIHRVDFIDEYWIKPINNKIHTSIFGVGTVDIDKAVEHTLEHIE